MFFPVHIGTASLLRFSLIARYFISDYITHRIVEKKLTSSLIDFFSGFCHDLFYTIMKQILMQGGIA